MVDAPGSGAPRPGGSQPPARSERALDVVVRNAVPVVLFALTSLFAWAVTWLRQDVVGFAFAGIGAAIAFDAARRRDAWRPLRLSPALVLLGSLGACEGFSSWAMHEGKKRGAAIAEACNRAQTCPLIPTDFVADAETSFPVPDASALVAGGRGRLIYTRDEDGRGFRLRVVGSTRSATFTGGVQRPLAP
ncbi:MAG: hypothetical protein FJ137_21330 [Deltaproteobacteria bacterium]|nr:hypothetical protein [Deltaproteobacteria bacterium]